MPKAPSTPRTKPAPYPSTSPASASRTDSTSSASTGGPITPSSPVSPLSARPQLKLEIPDIDFTPVKQEIRASEGEDELDSSVGEADGDGDWKPDVKVNIKTKGGAKKKGAAAEKASKLKVKPKAKAMAKADDGDEGGGDEGDGTVKGAKVGKGAKGEYNKVVLLTLIFAPCKPDWQLVADAANINHTQAVDLWRKSMLPNLINGRPWSETSPAFDKQTKVRMLVAIMDQLKIDWKGVAEYFPGRTHTLNDIWRKIVAPRLKRGDAAE